MSTRNMNELMMHSFDSFISNIRSSDTLHQLLQNLDSIRHLPHSHRTHLFESIRDHVVTYLENIVSKEKSVARSFAVQSRGLELFPRHVCLRIFRFNSIVSNMRLAYSNRFFFSLITNLKHHVLEFTQLNLMSYEHKFIAVHTDHKRILTYEKRFITNKRQKLLWAACTNTKRIVLEDVLWLTDIKLAKVISSAVELVIKLDVLNRFNSTIVSNFIFRQTKGLVLDGSADVLTHTKQELNFPKLEYIHIGGIFSPDDFESIRSSLAWGQDLVRPTDQASRNSHPIIREEWKLDEDGRSSLISEVTLPDASIPSTSSTIRSSGASDERIQDRVKEEVDKQTEYLRNIVQSLEEKLAKSNHEREDELREMEFEHCQFMEDVQLQHEQTAMQVKIEHQEMMKNMMEECEQKLEEMMESKLRLIQVTAIHMEKMRKRMNEVNSFS